MTLKPRQLEPGHEILYCKRRYVVLQVNELSGNRTQVKMERLIGDEKLTVVFSGQHNILVTGFIDTAILLGGTE